MSIRACVLRSAFAFPVLIVTLNGASLLGQGNAPSAASQPKPATQQTSEPNAALSSRPSCLEPEPFVPIDEYHGPFQKSAHFFSRKLERKTVHQPHYKPGTKLCSLTTGAKFRLFYTDTLEPVTFLAASFNAGLSQAANDDSKFGQGAEGYGNRYGAAFADQASGKFFKDFLYPSMFREDPRYYRMGHGKTSQRLWHALGHVFIGHKDSGRPMFNFSEWVGAASAVSLSNLYYPNNRRGFGPAAGRVGISIGADMGFDVLREFWPEVCRKLKLPFIRPEHSTTDHPQASSKQFSAS